MATNVTHPGWMIVHGVRLEIVERGQGRPILWLHGEEGLDPGAQFLDLLDCSIRNDRDKFVTGITC